jgi:hypothetical protein
MDILDKLERKRAFARARARKFYESNKEKVLSNQKSARERFAAEIEAAKVQRNIPLIRQPPPPPPRIEPEPAPRTFRIIRNNENEIVIALTLDRIKEKVKKLKGKTTEFISVNTQERYIQDAKTLLRILNVEELNTALKTPANVIQAIEDAKQIAGKNKGEPYSINSKKGLAQFLLVIVDNAWIGQSLKNTLHEPYFDYFESLDYKSREQSNEIQEYDDIDDYVKRIKEKFGENSKEFIVAMLYREGPRRDDFKLKIIENATEANDPKENYLVVPPNTLTERTVCQTVINAHKTAGHFDPLVQKLSPHLSHLIRVYIFVNNLDYGNYLFNNKSLSSFVSKMSKDVGLQGITINTLRHMAITKFLSTNPTMAERQIVAKAMGHSLKTQQSYAGKLRGTGIRRNRKK